MSESHFNSQSDSQSSSQSSSQSKLYFANQNLDEEQTARLATAGKYFQLEENEQVLNLIQRNSMSYYLPRIVRGVLFLVIYTILRFLILYEEIIQSPLFTNIVNWLLLLWGIYFLIALLVGKKFVGGHTYIITTKRIILIRKFLGILFREIEYKRITDLVLQQTFFGRFANYGNLMPVTAGIEMNSLKMGMYSIEGIPNVFEMRQLIISQIQKIQMQLLEDFKPQSTDNSEKADNHSVNALSDPNFKNE